MVGRPISERRGLRPALALALALLAAAPARAGDLPGSPRRIVAIGDIHGAYNALRSILREVGLVDEHDRWVGGDALLVQTGDFLDRGPGATRVANLLMDLQEQAPEHGGEVVVLLGNHEALNLLGDRRDVTKYILRNFVDRNSDRRLDASCNAYARFHRRMAERRQQEPPKRRELVERCRAEQEPGLVEYLREIGPKGDIGRWLRGLPTAVQLDGVVFVHGGIGPELAGPELEEINREVRREIETFDRARRRLLDLELILPTTELADVVAMARLLEQAYDADPEAGPAPEDIRELAGIEGWHLLREDGPLWFRGYGSWEEEEGRALLPAILEALGAERIVVAHTPQESHSIAARFDSRAFLIDTGMLHSVYGGRPSALEIRDGRFTALYTMQKIVLLEPAAVAAAE